MKKIFLACLFLLPVMLQAQSFERLMSAAHVNFKINHNTPANINAQKYSCSGVLLAPNWLLTRASCVPGGTGKTYGSLNPKIDYLYNIDIELDSVRASARFYPPPAASAGRVGVQNFGLHRLSEGSKEKDDFALLDMSVWALPAQLRAKMQRAYYPPVMLFRSDENLKSFLYPKGSYHRVIYTVKEHLGHAIDKTGHTDKCYVMGFNGVQKGGPMFIADNNGRPVILLAQYNSRALLYDIATFVPKTVAFAIQDITGGAAKFVNSYFQEVNLVKLGQDDNSFSLKLSPALKEKIKQIELSVQKQDSLSRIKDASF